MSELEEALARRESSLVEIQTHFSDNVKEREADERDYVKRIQELEDLLMQEKSNQRELRKQVSVSFFSFLFSLIKIFFLCLYIYRLNGMDL